MALAGNLLPSNFDHATEHLGTGHSDNTTISHKANELVHDVLKDDSNQDNTQRSKSPNDVGEASGSGEIVVDSSSEDQRENEKEHALNALARRATRETASSGDPGDPLNPEKDSPLDPHSENFRAKSWLKALLALSSDNPDATPRMTSGVAFRSLSAHGYGASTDYQKSVGNVWLNAVGIVRKLIKARQRKIEILRDFDGVVRSGEMLVVLGPPGSGCSTFLKSISGDTYGFVVDDSTYLNYQGISAEEMHKTFRGEAIYMAELDVHFPILSVADTLTFAARARAPRHPPRGLSQKAYADLIRDGCMAMFGISHTANTKVGNDFVRGISGGERKRVSIAEALLSGSPLQVYDNSTRGLDSANAVQFLKNLRTSVDLVGSAALVSIYQAPQSAYDLFDKAMVLYEGRQIYFGPAHAAKSYFERMGFQCRHRQTTADFLTSMTSPAERYVRPGFEDRAPRTSEEFAKLWKESGENQDVLREIEMYSQEHPMGGTSRDQFIQSRRALQAKLQRRKSPFMLSYIQQVQLCLWRGFKRLKNDPSYTVGQLIGNFIMALIVGSLFYNLDEDTNSFFVRGSLLFFAVLLNAFGSALEILALYAQRAIVEKHGRYALYHPSAEGVASMMTDVPYKIINAVTFNVPLYFLTNLRREADAFFFFLLVSFMITLVMSMLFRTVGSITKSLAQAMAPTSVVILALVMYTGFVIPIPYMLGWIRWIRHVNPIAYGFESLIINEFHDREFSCTSFVPFGPGYDDVGPFNQVCVSVGSVPGSDTVDGDRYIESAFDYRYEHKWRNVGILLAFVVGYMIIYLYASELVSAKKSKGEVLVFRRGHASAKLKKTTSDDPEVGSHKPIVAEKSHDASNAQIQKQTAIFHWRDVCYDIKVKKKEIRILDRVDGWVTPGTLTALMGVSGAGKTTLLDVLAARATIGVISGEMLVDGQPRDASFQRKTGYVQQQDLHLSTATVREALNFSALLRQPNHIPRNEKLAYVDEVIKLLDMQEYAEAIVGVPGEGLNVEQRKRLTIATELVARPQLLLFLDEPTSGLDSQTSWIICDLMETLTKNGQAIMCTIHQPSALLFQRFDRLLLLADGGKTVYFGDIGDNSSTVIDYFERNSGHHCPEEANPAEWMLEVIGAAPGSHTEKDWQHAWRSSPEYCNVQDELARFERSSDKKESYSTAAKEQLARREFAAPFHEQLWQVTRRVFAQYWYSPSYIYSKALLCVGSALFIGLSFIDANNTLQGLQNQLFSIFLLMMIFGQLIQQMLPQFVTQRALYEARERPSKVYSWKAFMLANIFVEIPWNALMALFIFICWYYPVGLYRNAEPTDSVHERGILMFLLILVFLLFASTFAAVCIAGIETAENGGNMAGLAFLLMLVFSGVLVTRNALPEFWIFMNRVSPFTYLISGMLSTGVADARISCADNEFLNFDPLDGQTCGEYMENYIERESGYLLNPDARAGSCEFCPQDSTNVFLADFSSYFSEAWRNFGLIWAYIVFNVFAALLIYWLVRMPKGNKKKEKEKKKNRIGWMGRRRRRVGEEKKG